MLLSSVFSICFIFITILCYCCNQAVDGYPFGAGGCTGGAPAVGGFHLSTLYGLRDPQLKTLSSDFKNITVTIGNVTMDTTNVGPTISFKANTVYEYKISSISRNMRGILMRVLVPAGTSANVTNGMIVPNRNTHIASNINDGKSVL